MSPTSRKHEKNRDPLVPDEVRAAWREAGAPEPAELVDRAVLNRARAAVESSTPGRPWSFGWPHTVTTAAVLVLGVTLLLQLRDQAPGVSQPPPPAPASRTVPADAVRTPPARDSVSADEPVPDRMLRAPTPEAEAVRDEIDPAASAAGISRRQDVIEQDAAPAAPAEQQPAQGTRLLEEALLKNEIEIESADVEHRARRSQSEETDPERLLAEIRRLLDAGEFEDAREALARFRLAFPDHPLPEDLATAFDAP